MLVVRIACIKTHVGLSTMDAERLDQVLSFGVEIFTSNFALFHLCCFSGVHFNFCSADDALEQEDAICIS